MGNTLVPGKASEAELSRMMETYGAMLTGTCTVLLGDRHLAQDIVQETFIRAYKKMDSFRGERPESEKSLADSHRRQSLQGRKKKKVVPL